jgi:hypothetical protein
MRESKSATALAAIAILGSILALSCAGGRHSAPTIADVRGLPYKRATAYSSDIGATLAKDVPARVGAAPAVLLEYLRQSDGNPSYSAYSPSEGERALLSDYFGLLPPRFQAAMKAKVLGVYFIENFASGGLSDYVFRDDVSMLIILVLNPKTLRLGLSEWIGYRDASAYEDDGKGVELKSACAGGEKYRGLLHTLTHEAAHIFDYSEAVTPYVERHLALASEDASTKDFTRGIWESYAKPISAYAIPDRDRLAPYGLGKSLPLSVAVGQYKALAKTPFASLYGASCWAEDFAETAAWTWLKRRLGIAYEVRVLRSGREEVRFSPPGAEAPAARAAALSSVLD